MALKYEKLNSLITYLTDEKRTIKQLRLHLGLSERTVFRYIKNLEQMDLGLEKLSGDSKEIKYMIPNKQSQAVPKDIIEVINDLRRDLVRTGNHKYRKALDEIQKVLDPKNKSDLNQNRVAIKSDSNCELSHGPFAEYAEKEPNSVNKALQAIETQQLLRITYVHSYSEFPIDGESRQDEDSETFVFIPYKVVLRVGRLYLLGAHEDEPDNIRPYPFRRIKFLKVISKTQARNKFDVNNYYENCVGQWVPYHKTARVKKVVLEIKEDWLLRVFNESNFNPPAKVINSRKGFPRVELKIYDTYDLENMIMQFMPNLRVKEPKDLVEKIKKRLADANHFQKGVK